MQVINTSYMAYGENVYNVTVELDDKETINAGDKVPFTLVDDTVVELEIKIINPHWYQDYAVVCERIANEIKSGKEKPSPETTKSISGPCSCEICVQLEEDMLPIKLPGTTYEDYLKAITPVEIEEICITPYKEILMGAESIYDHIDKTTTVPEDVIKYLKIKNFYAVCMGIYNHPFKEEVHLCGPYQYYDGKYYWDRDTWKYVVKYGLTLPEDFINHVLSEEGQAFLREHSEIEHETAYEVVEKSLADRKHVNFMSPDGYDIDIDNF